MSILLGSRRASSNNGWAASAIGFGVFQQNADIAERLRRASCETLADMRALPNSAASSVGLRIGTVLRAVSKCDAGCAHSYSESKDW